MILPEAMDSPLCAQRRPSSSRAARLHADRSAVSNMEPEPTYLNPGMRKVRTGHTPSPKSPRPARRNAQHNPRRR